jgi:hypothetical protein
MINDAPFPFQGVFPDPFGDMVRLDEVVQFKVARDADAGRAASAGWEAAGGLGRGASMSATARRAAVDAALALQALPLYSFPPHYWMPTDVENSIVSLLPPGAPPRNHVAASVAFSAAMEALSRRAGACPQSAAGADAVDVHHAGDELCLRNLVLFEQQACPYTGPGTGDDITPLLFGPLAGQPLYGPAGLGDCPKVGMTGKCINNKDTFDKSTFFNDCGVTPADSPTPVRLLLGTAEVTRDIVGKVASILPMTAPMGFESPVTEWVPLRKDKLTGQLYRQEVWDLYNWTPGALRMHAACCAVCICVHRAECVRIADMHPMHFHLATLRVLARYVVPILPDKDGNGYVDENEARTHSTHTRVNVATRRACFLNLFFFPRFFPAVVWRRVLGVPGARGGARREGHRQGEPVAHLGRAEPAAARECKRHLPWHRPLQPRRQRQRHHVRAVPRHRGAPFRALHRVVQAALRALHAPPHGAFVHAFAAQSPACGAFLHAHACSADAARARRCCLDA